MGQYYAINGSFLLEPALGVQRYAAEILKQMNKMAPAYKECLRRAAAAAGAGAA